MAGQEGLQFVVHADGSHAGAAAAVRNSEGLVQVEVAYVRAYFAGRGKAHLRVHVGAVHVNQSAAGVDGIDHFLDAASYTPCVLG
jgi:hypothetical protein